jgi:hypothetical protein
LALKLHVAASSGIALCQRKFALDILADTGQLAAKLAKFPMKLNAKFSTSDGILLKDPTSYRKLIG